MWFYKWHLCLCARYLPYWYLFFFLLPFIYLFLKSPFIDVFCGGDSWSQILFSYLIVKFTKMSLKDSWLLISLAFTALRLLFQWVMTDFWLKKNCKQTLVDIVHQDTEFPGVVVRPIGEFRSTVDYQYQLLRCNVDLLKIIQLGLTFMNEEGDYPPGTTTWQFNFKFNLTWVDSL